MRSSLPCAIVPLRCLYTALGGREKRNGRATTTTPTTPMTQTTSRSGSGPRSGRATCEWITLPMIRRSGLPRTNKHKSRRGIVPVALIDQSAHGCCPVSFSPVSCMFVVLPSWITSGATMAARATTATRGVCATRRAKTETRTESSDVLRWTRCMATTAVYATTTSNWPARTTPRTTAPSCALERDHPSFIQRKLRNF